MLESGAADGPIVRLSVIVPSVVLGRRGALVRGHRGRRAQHAAVAVRRAAPRPAAVLRATRAVRDGLGGGRRRIARHLPRLVRQPRPHAAAAADAQGDRDLHVPTGGYTVELRPHEPQGINPRDLLLDKVVVEPTGPVPDVITDVEVRYEEITDVEYDTVTILPDGPSVEVEDVH